MMSAMFMTTMKNSNNRYADVNNVDCYYFVSY
jgi:hypothetical protein